MLLQDVILEVRILVAEYSKNTPSHGLIVYMPTLSDVARVGTSVPLNTATRMTASSTSTTVPASAPPS